MWIKLTLIHIYETVFLSLQNPFSLLSNLVWETQKIIVVGVPGPQAKSWCWVQAPLPRDRQSHEQHLQEVAGPVCSRGSVLALHISVEKPKKAKPEALARFWRWRLRQGRRDAANSIVLLLEGSAGAGPCGSHGLVSSKQGVGTRELLSISLALWNALFAHTQRNLGRKNLSKSEESYWNPASEGHAPGGVFGGNCSVGSRRVGGKS